MMNHVWEQALNNVQQRVGSHTYDVWIRPIRCLRSDEDGLHLQAPNLFLKDWFETHYLGCVLDELRTLSASAPRIEWSVLPEMQHVAEQNHNCELQPDSRCVVQGQEGQGRRPIVVEASSISVDAAVARVPAAPLLSTSAEDNQLSRSPGRPMLHRPAPAPAPQGLLPRYRFDCYVRGAGNELATSAAMAAAERPGSRFNPLFIYGQSGLGKTHLLHAVGHELHRLHPHLRIHYISAECFMNEFVRAVRQNAFDEFRARYRQGCDCLLIDDIQFIAGRDRTMDEFFHVFNALHEAGRQIVVTADRSPSEMEGMEERLISRLNWGLVADVQAPDIETRIAIVDQMSDREGIRIPPSSKVVLAEIIRSNVRELEGALLRVAACSELRGVAINDLFVRETLSHSAAPNVNTLTVEAIQKAVSAYYSVRISDLKGPRRHRSIARPRMLAMYLSRELTGASFPEIGHRFGGKDHTTVMNACRRIKTLASEDHELRDALESLSYQLQSRVA